MTIDELMQGKQPGEIKIRAAGWRTEAWFRPYYRTARDSGSQWWYGSREDGCSSSYVTSEAGWEICRQPVATRCEDCERLRKERDEAVAVLVFIKGALAEWEAEK